MRNSVLSGIIAVTLLACGSSQSPSQPTPSPTARTDGKACPMLDPGDAIAVIDTDDGVAMELTTTGDVADLRARVRRMADMHEQMRAKHASGDISDERQQMHGGMMHPQMLASPVTVEEVPGGARLVFVPSDPSGLAGLRAQTREHAAMLENGECAMMGSRPA